MGMMLARRGALAERAFNPLTFIPVLHGSWADDPLWTNPGDGAAVTSWRNHSGGGDPASSGANRPTFDAVNPAYGNRATLHFASASNQRLNVDIANVAQAFKVVIVGDHGNAGAGERIMGFGTALANGIGHGAGNVWSLQAGTALTGSASDLNPRVFRATVNGASSQLWVNESSVASGNAGTNQLVLLTLGAGSLSTSSFGNPLNGDIAFYGIYPSTVSDASLSVLVAKLRAYYAI